MNDIPAFTSQGDGPVLLFLHGIGGNRQSFDSQLPAFADQWRAVSWDMPGYGDSAPLAEMTFENLAHSVADLLDHLEAPSSAIVGHSMGGMVAQEFMVHYPDRAAALVLSATSPSFGKPGGEWQEWFLGQRLAPLDRGLSPADFANELVPNLMAENPSDAAVSAAMASMSALSSETYRAALHCLVRFNQRAKLRDIACPTLALAGEHDEAAPASMMEKMSGYIPDCRYHCLPGVGHLANLENPDNFNQAIRGFLDEVA
ncbi:MAG: alpha/beta hydrolase [Rhodospirillaceae bacterium]|jgi:3-oxoadipate enol-lactonase|nr:alpha/beta hydrolase [Rhodospirillaceae bacterium]MBT4490723.1 alpha/beta hydrolase [Rhodospirillaceae bacterium]MBT5193274.1 alpha/beta hydrolase [Rhodospirillaceae bacterium]MBT5898082.1 alpha/beta hydrolase [Rhodospirillaceae bacterium]MBT6427376.1 alpha/beta hydrolase [Rhodospirillaceae bacterium]